MFYDYYLELLIIEIILFPIIIIYIIIFNIFLNYFFILKNKIIIIKLVNNNINKRIIYYNILFCKKFDRI